MPITVFHFEESKILPRGDDSFKVLKRINDNVNVLNLPMDFGDSTTFNVCDLSPYDVCAKDQNLRRKFLQEGRM
ncbi:hypothetical protein CR513_23443, partial [Mucuna pruriens]